MNPMRSNRTLLALGLMTLGLASAAWLVSSQRDLHDRLAQTSPALATGFVVVTSTAAIMFAAVSVWQFVRLNRPPSPPVKAPEDIIEAAQAQAARAEANVDQIADEAARQTLRKEIASVQDDARNRRFHVVIFGTGSAGKTSLINALLGREVGKTEATIGTTQHGENHAYGLDDVEGVVVITDTPGLSEIGAGGVQREREARDLAVRADLLIFLLDHDLIRSEQEPLAALIKQGKRSIIALNKTDRMTESDKSAILAKLRERLRGLVKPDDIVPIAAAPRPTPVRVIGEDGRVTTVLEPEGPDLDALHVRIAAMLAQEGDAVRAGNLLLRAHLVSKAAREQISKERDLRAKKVVEKFQWMTAGTVFVNPIPALDLMATGAVQFQMISELAAVYGVEVSASHLKTIASQMVQMLLKLGIAEAASSLIAGVFKSTLVGYAAGGSIQAATMAYLTHISGLTFIEYFQRGQTWGDGGLEAALNKQFNLHSRAEFLKEFAHQAVERVRHKYFDGTKQNVG